VHSGFGESNVKNFSYLFVMQAMAVR